MTEQAWILSSILLAIVVLSLIAWILFTPPRPAVPTDGPIRFAVRPFRNLEPDPQHLYLGDSFARDIVASLKRYERIEATIDDGPARFVMDGSIRKTGPRLAMQFLVTSDNRRFWKSAYEAKLQDVPKIQAKAIDALAKAMKLSLREA